MLSWSWMKSDVIINYSKCTWHFKSSRKSVRWSAVPVPCLNRLWLKLKGEQGSDLKGVDDLCFHLWGIFYSFSFSSSVPLPSPQSQHQGSNPSLEVQIPALQPKSHPWGPNHSWGFKDGIWASRQRFGPQDWDLGPKAGIWASRLGFGPQGWDMGLKAGIWASRLGFRPQGWDLGLEAKIWVRDGDGRRRRRRKKSPICVKA